MSPQIAQIIPTLPQCKANQCVGSWLSGDAPGRPISHPQKVQKRPQKWGRYPGGRCVAAQHGPCPPVEVVAEAFVDVLPDAVDVPAGQADGELQELLGEEQRPHCGVEPGGGAGRGGKGGFVSWGAPKVTLFGGNGPSPKWVLVRIGAPCPKVGSWRVNAPDPIDFAPNPKWVKPPNPILTSFQLTAP